MEAKVSRERACGSCVTFGPSEPTRVPFPGNVGVGVLRTSFLRAHPLSTRLRVIEHPNFSIAIRIAFFRGRYLGTREQVALELQRMLVNHFENASA
jgi:hypothetical protein